MSDFLMRVFTDWVTAPIAWLVVVALGLMFVLDWWHWRNVYADSAAIDRRLAREAALREAARTAPARTAAENCEPSASDEVAIPVRRIK